MERGVTLLSMRKIWAMERPVARAEASLDVFLLGCEFSSSSSSFADDGFVNSSLKALVTVSNDQMKVLYTPIPVACYEENLSQNRLHLLRGFHRRAESRSWCRCSALYPESSGVP